MEEIKKPDLAKVGMEPLSRLDNRQRLVLMDHIKREGFVIQQMIMEDQIKLLNERLINTNPQDISAVLANHSLVKSAGMFYHGMLKRFEEEAAIANSSLSTLGSIDNPEQPVYPIEFAGQEE